MTKSQRYQEGLEVRRDVLGAEYVDRATKNSHEFMAPFQDLVTEYCWGSIWTRPGLDRKTRSLLNLTMLSALRQWEELRLHLRGAIVNGCSVEEIQEALLQVTIYCGVPAGLEAFRLATAVLGEMGLTSTKLAPLQTNPQSVGGPTSE